MLGIQIFPLYYYLVKYSSFLNLKTQILKDIKKADKCTIITSARTCITISDNNYNVKLSKCVCVEIE